MRRNRQKRLDVTMDEIIRVRGRRTKLLKLFTANKLKRYDKGNKF